MSHYFLDTEFDENGKTIELISLALVADDGRELYVVSTEFDPDKCNDWVKANVLPKLPEKNGDTWWCSREEIRYRILKFVEGDTGPKFWAYFADYDWVVFCQLWGAMVNLPSKFPMFCLDLKQLLWHSEIFDIKERVPQSEVSKHDALDDARWNRQVYQWLKNHPSRVSFRF